MFCDNLKAQMDALGMTAKDVANAMEGIGFAFRRAKHPHRVVESWISKSRPYHPELLTGTALARVLNTTVEELVDGEAGAAYVRQLASKEGWGFSPPDRISDIVEGLSLLDDNELDMIRAAVASAVERKRGTGTGMDGLLG
jgi:hypothetical protein